VQALIGLGDAELAMGGNAAAVAAYERARTSLRPDEDAELAELAEKVARARGR
jgi:hypothetical protein